jgi:hypothetical protein
MLVSVYSTFLYRLITRLHPHERLVRSQSALDKDPGSASIGIFESGAIVLYPASSGCGRAGKKIKLILVYSMTTGRSFDEIIRVN